MLYLLLISIVLLMLFALVKIWETKKGKVIFLSKFLASQDEKVRRIAIIFFRRWSNFKKRLKIFIFSQLPAYCFLLLEKAVARLASYYNRLRYYIRGKLQIKKDRSQTSHFLKEIAKVKEENRENGRTTDL